MTSSFESSDRHLDMMSEAAVFFSDSDASKTVIIYLM